ncbi:hypothetical protein JTE90_028325 [Oedothorax gibbosus]|uniref:Uncharacterized protein n=1 Tax=Oedothorax gibbosus TaxID=931172 RepID=A0AAV6V4L3_9ARAC|nr:hypothetical protein JTE90_028325 [Oedothorax gibbosus]
MKQARQKRNGRQGSAKSHRRQKAIERDRPGPLYLGPLGYFGMHSEGRLSSWHPSLRCAIILITWSGGASLLLFRIFGEWTCGHMLGWTLEGIVLEEFKNGLRLCSQ